MPIRALSHQYPQRGSERKVCYRPRPDVSRVSGRSIERTFRLLDAIARTNPDSPEECLSDPRVRTLAVAALCTERLATGNEVSPDVTQFTKEISSLGL